MEDRQNNAENKQHCAYRLGETLVKAYQTADGAALPAADVPGFMGHKKAGKEQGKADKHCHEYHNSTQFGRHIPTPLLIFSSLYRVFPGSQFRKKNCHKDFTFTDFSKLSINLV